LGFNLNLALSITPEGTSVGLSVDSADGGGGTKAATGAGGIKAGGGEGGGTSLGIKLGLMRSFGAAATAGETGAGGGVAGVGSATGGGVLADGTGAAALVSGGRCRGLRRNGGGGWLGSSLIC
jgi:hypothetical protein